jgi:hypothetical protein
MKQVSYPLVGVASGSSLFRIKKPKQRNILGFVIAALHYSRRLQARRVLRQYRHLIAQSEENGIHGLFPGALLVKSASATNAVTSPGESISASYDAASPQEQR